MLARPSYLQPRRLELGQRRQGRELLLQALEPGMAQVLVLVLVLVQQRSMPR